MPVRQKVLDDAKEGDDVRFVRRGGSGGGRDYGWRTGSRLWPSAGRAGGFGRGGRRRFVLILRTARGIALS